MSIMDILLENADGRDLQDVDVMTDVAKKALFGKELNYISEEHRDHFAAGFAYHYFFDEIGMSPFAGWRMSLIEKIHNNADFINQTYDLIDKQIFANYKTNRVIGRQKDTNVVNANISENSNSNSTHVSDNVTNSEDNENIVN